MEESEESKTYQYLVLLLGFASLVLAIASLFVMEVLATNYGIGLGAGLQSNYTNTNVTSVLVPSVLQVSNLNNAMREVYLLALISFGMLGASLILYMGRFRRGNAMSRRYTLLHTTLVFIYAALFYIILSNFQINFASVYFLFTYAAAGAAIAIDLYLEFGIHITPSVGAARRSVSIEPHTPYTNLVKLREGIFSTLKGNVRIVDKNFNSDAIANLNRLLETNLKNIQKIEVLTSAQTLDSKFNDNYTDFRNELKNAGVELNFLLMSDQDGVAQHERFIFDDERAYKIPPLNIINKRSEHIVNLRVGEARHRFDTLMRNATKYDNYVVKQARGPDAV